mgnify:CR=1 FL=1
MTVGDISVLMVITFLLQILDYLQMIVQHFENAFVQLLLARPAGLQCLQDKLLIRMGCKDLLTVAGIYVIIGSILLRFCHRMDMKQFFVVCSMKEVPGLN